MGNVLGGRRPQFIAPSIVPHVPSSARSCCPIASHECAALARLQRATMARPALPDVARLATLHAPLARLSRNERSTVNPKGHQKIGECRLRHSAAAFHLASSNMALFWTIGIMPLAPYSLTSGSCLTHGLSLDDRY
ncbi:MAG: hypothetical protein RMM98_08220 [Acidobacteriota bacterium]|nr:hypothetical protein [Acidobacteriota bacterium]